MALLLPAAAETKTEVYRENIGKLISLNFQVKEGTGTYQYLRIPFQVGQKHSPCRTNKAREVTKVLLNEIIPRFEVPTIISSDRGTYFVQK